MSNILSVVNSKRCTGCSSCVYSCPKQIIDLKQNEVGFYVAVIKNVDDCIDCSACLKKCYTNITKAENSILSTVKSVYYGWANDEIRKNGTSGGVVSSIYSHYLKSGGIVFGACLDKDNWTLSHKKIDTLDGLDSIVKSKYLQSNMGETIGQIKRILEERKRVVFCGTPCQTYAVKIAFTNHAQRDYLVLIDFICHGVPSQYVFKDYIRTLEKKKNSKVIEYEFRSKKRGWSHITVGAELETGEIIYSRGQLDEYYYLFSNSINLNSACYECPFKNTHFSDLSVADYWGIFRNAEAQKSIDCIEKGVSLISVWTECGEKVLDELSRDTNVNHFVSLPLNAANYTFDDLEDKELKKICSKNFYEDYQAYGYKYCIKKYANNLKGKIIKQYMKNLVNKIK